MADEFYGETYLTADEVAERLKVTPRFVRESDIPAVLMGHKTIRYRMRDVDAWAAARVQPAPPKVRSRR